MLWPNQGSLMGELPTPLSTLLVYDLFSVFCQNFYWLAINLGCQNICLCVTFTLLIVGYMWLEFQAIPLKMISLPYQYYQPSKTCCWISYIDVRYLICDVKEGNARYDAPVYRTVAGGNVSSSASLPVGCWVIGSSCDIVAGITMLSTGSGGQLGSASSITSTRQIF